MKSRVQMGRFMQVQSLHTLLHSSQHNDVLFSFSAQSANGSFYAEARNVYLSSPSPPPVIVS